MNTQDSEKNKSLTNALQSLKFLQRKKQSSKLQIANLETSKLLLRKLGINESEIEAINEKSLEYINLSKCKYEELIAKGDAENVDIIRYIKKHQTLPMAFLPFYKSGSRGIVNFSGGGQGGFPPPDPWGPPQPPPTDDLHVDALHFLQHGIVHAEGRGSGWLNDKQVLGDDEQTDTKSFDFNFPKFRVPMDGFYKINIFIMVVGKSFTIADDSWWNYKNAYCRVDIGGNITQYTPKMFNPQYGFETFGITLDSGSPAWHTQSSLQGFDYSQGGDNINEIDNMVVTTNLFYNNSKAVWLFKDFDVDLVAGCYLTAVATGSGSIADINCDNNNGGIYCLGVTLHRL